MILSPRARAAFGAAKAFALAGTAVLSWAWVYRGVGGGLFRHPRLLPRHPMGPRVGHDPGVALRRSGPVGGRRGSRGGHQERKGLRRARGLRGGGGVGLRLGLGMASGGRPPLVRPDDRDPLELGRAVDGPGVGPANALLRALGGPTRARQEGRGRISGDPVDAGGHGQRPLCAGFGPGLQWGGDLPSLGLASGPRLWNQLGIRVQGQARAALASRRSRTVGGGLEPLHGPSGSRPVGGGGRRLRASVRPGRRSP